jgi:hypothetical protein
VLPGSGSRSYRRECDATDFGITQRPLATAPESANAPSAGAVVPAVYPVHVPRSMHVMSATVRLSSSEGKGFSEPVREDLGS